MSDTPERIPSAPERADGMHLDWNEDDYHAHPALGSSDVRALLVGRTEYVSQRLRRPTERRQQRFDVGSALHSHLIGGREVHPIADSWARRADRDARDELRAAGHLPLTHNQADRVLEAADAVRADPNASALLGLARPDEPPPVIGYEVSLLSSVAADAAPARAIPVPVKGRLDVARLRGVTGGWLSRWVNVDLKSTTTVAVRDLRRSLLDYGYHVQGAHYSIVAAQLDIEITPDAHYIVWVSVEPPHRVQVTRIAPAAVERGIELCHAAYATWAHATAADDWADAPAGVVDLDLPPWGYDDEIVEYL